MDVVVVVVVKLSSEDEWMWGVDRFGTNPELPAATSFPFYRIKATTSTMPDVPKLEQLSRPEPLQNVMAEETKLQYDCLPCKVTGKESASRKTSPV